MKIAGEELHGVVSAKDFVGWYNGFPAAHFREPNLKCETVSIVGIGNVALDVARILLSPIDRLRSTDMPENVIQCLCDSRVRKVNIISRRGPLHVAFTLKEFRELTRLPGNKAGEDRIAINLLPHGIFQQTVSQPQDIDSFIQGEPDLNQKAEACSGSALELLPTDLLVRSIGYKAVRIDPDLPFDEEAGHIDCDRITGRVADSCMYAVGWVKKGPHGTIVDAAVDAKQTAESVLQQLQDEVQSKPGSEHVLRLCREKGIKVVSFKDWERMDIMEKSAGHKLGKPREKLLTVQDMIKAAFTQVSRNRS
ncbi:hypothetical protein Ciccas_014012 [Cichlidogyrus casuarinus]|uniref:NADPH:adrenodoxin oxidoreductase, mitochondrial n=1 Tax=Cichlidogyrus casuarinus TaxID=1844966 RepID=A0ABD2PJ40_9PLAT